MDTQHHQKIKEHIQKSQHIGIVVNKNPNLDYMAAGLGLYLSLKNAGKNVTIVSPTEPIVEISNLVGIDKVKKSLGARGGDLIISVPYRDGEIDRVTSEQKDDYLHLIIKAGEKGLSFQEQDIIFDRGGKPVNLLFAIGVQRLQDVHTVVSPEVIKDAVIVNLDNRTDNEQFGDVVVVSPKFSSLSEQIADFLTLPDASLPIDTDIAQNLLSGITYATNDFQDPKTSHLAFEMAGILMRKGAVRYRNPHREEKRPQQTFIPRQQQPRPVQQASQYPVQQQSRPVQSVQQPVRPPQPIGQQHSTQSTPQPQQAQSISQPQDAATPEQSEQPDVKQAPADWLQPKVYKGSTFS